MSLKSKVVAWFLREILEAVIEKKLNLRMRAALWLAQRKVDSMKGSWKTTAAGICAILVAIGTAIIALVDGDPKTSINFEATMVAISAGVGLLAARDNDKSSEQVGAK